MPVSVAADPKAINEDETPITFNVESKDGAYNASRTNVFTSSR